MTAFDIKAWVRPELTHFKPYASARAVAGEDGSADVIALDANENPWPTQAGRPLNRYPDPQPATLRRALADHYGVDSSMLLVTRGSDEGIDLLIRLVCRPGVDAVMINTPCFGMYALYAQLQGAEVVDVPLIKGERQWAVDWLRIREAKPCRLYFLCSPNNPTGQGIEAVDVLALAQQVSDHGLVVVDEAYIEFSEHDSLVALIAHQPNLVVLRTLSKAFGLAGARLGSVLASETVIDWLARIIAPYPLPTPSIEAALAALEPNALSLQHDHLRSLKADKQRLVDALQSLPYVRHLWVGEGNFVLIEVDDASSLMQHCLNDGIRLRNQSHQPNLNNSIRITVGTDDETSSLIASLVRFGQ